MAAHHPPASVTDEAMESLPTEMPLNRSQPKWLKALTGRWYNPADIALVYLAKAVSPCPLLNLNPHWSVTYGRPIGN